MNILTLYGTISLFLLLIADSVLAQGYISALYYTHWSWPNHYPAYIPLSQVTHIYYAFADIDTHHLNIKFPNTYVSIHGLNSFSTYTLKKDVQYLQDLIEEEEVSTSETSCDEHIGECETIESLPWIDDYIEAANNMRPYMLNGGVIGQMRELRRLNPRLKISMSIGGQDSDNKFKKITNSIKKIKQFVTNIVANMNSFGFDGIDVDWEFPDESVSDQFVCFIKYLHQELSVHPTKKYLSIAIPLDLEVLQHFKIGQIDEYVDHYNLMGYDITTPESKQSGYLSQLYPDPNLNSAISVDDTVTYLRIFTHSSKIVLGMPAYGRGYNVDRLYKSFKGCAEIENYFYDSDKECIIDYIDLPPEKYIEVSNTELGTAFAYNKDGPGMIFYDTPETVRIKARYVKDAGLGGGMWWDSKGDPLLSNTSRSLVYQFVSELGGVRALCSDVSPAVVIAETPNAIVTENVNQTDFTAISNAPHSRDTRSIWYLSLFVTFMCAY